MFGVLSWFHKDLNTGNFTPYSLISGIERGSKLKWTVPELKDSKKEINNILLQTVAEGKVVSANFTNIMHDLRQLCKDLENRIEKLCREKGLTALNWERKKDILIKFQHGKK